MSAVTVTIDQALDAAKDKVAEGTYFLNGMRQIEMWSHENLADAQRYFKCELSAFLSAARSVLQTLSEAVGWGAIDATRGSWTTDEQKLERTLSGRDVAARISPSGERATDVTACFAICHSLLTMANTGDYGRRKTGRAAE